MGCLGRRGTLRWIPASQFIQGYLWSRRIRWTSWRWSERLTNPWSIALNGESVNRKGVLEGVGSRNRLGRNFTERRDAHRDDWARSWLIKTPGTESGVSPGFRGCQVDSSWRRSGSPEKVSEDSRGCTRWVRKRNDGPISLSRSYPSFDTPDVTGALFLERRNTSSLHFSSMLLAVGGGARQGFKLVDLVVFYHRISADYPTGQFYFVGHGILLVSWDG